MVVRFGDMNTNNTEKQKKLETIREISQLADGMTLEYLEELKKRIDDTDLAPKERQKVFSEMDKILRIAKQYSDRVLLAEGKATENIGVGRMDRPFNVLITKTYSAEDKGQEAIDSD